MDVHLTTDGPRQSFHGKTFVEITAATTGVDCDSPEEVKRLKKEEKYQNVIIFDVCSDQVT